MATEILESEDGTILLGWTEDGKLWVSDEFKRLARDFVVALDLPAAPQGLERAAFERGLRAAVKELDSIRAVAPLAVSEVKLRILQIKYTSGE